MSALDRMQGDVARVAWEHLFDGGGDCWCGWSADPSDPAFLGRQYTAHVSERVMAMLTEEWGIREDVGHNPITRATTGNEQTLGVYVRLVTNWSAWSTDTGHPAHDDTDEGA